MTLTMERAIEIIAEKRIKENEKIIQEFPVDGDLKILNGRFGAYLTFEKKNYKIPKGTDPKTMTLEECQRIIRETEPTKPFRGNRKK